MDRPLHPLARFDPGWLFLIPGAVILAATVLIPAQDDLAVAAWRHEQAEAALEHRRDRLRNYTEYLDALDRGDEAVLLDLAARQLNLAPAGRKPMLMPAAATSLSASVFPQLEPPPPQRPRLDLPQTILRRLTTDNRTRLWLAAAGALCILFGVLPPTVRVHPRH